MDLAATILLSSLGHGMDERLHERSYGIVPLKKEALSWQVFLVCHQSGHWSLPKGRAEPGETALECAKRELFEETGLTVRSLLVAEPRIERYQFVRNDRLVDKIVEYFIAEVEGSFHLQLSEIKEARWEPLESAFHLVTYPQMKELLSSVARMLARIESKP